MDDLLERWRGGPVGLPTVGAPALRSGSAVFSTRPLERGRTATPAIPEDVNGVPVAEHIRTRRDKRGALVVAGGRPLRGDRAAAGARRPASAPALRAAAAGNARRSRRARLVAGGDRRACAINHLRFRPRGWHTVASPGSPIRRTCGWRIRLWTGTNRDLPSWGTSRSSTAGGRGSRTSRSPSRSSRSSRGASRPIRRRGTSAARSPSRGAGRSSSCSSSLSRSAWPRWPPPIRRRAAPTGGPTTRRPDLVLVHGLVQPARAGRHRRERGLVLRPVLHLRLQPLGPRLHPQLRGRGLTRRDLHRVHGDPLPARDDQHLLVASGRAVQQHLGVLALRRRRS